MTQTSEHDPLERLATYRPSQARIDSEWSPGERAAVRARIMTSSRRTPLRWRPRPRRLPLMNPAAASAAAIVAIIVGVVLVAVRSAQSSGGTGAGGQRTLTATRNTATVGNGQYARRTMTTYRVAADGTATTGEQGTVWAASDGAQWMNGNLSARGCVQFAAPSAASFDRPNAAFLAQLPTTPAALEAFMRTKVEGSSSQDEALFVATGDMLRDSDLLASAPQRAALVSMLSGLGGITLHADVSDYLGRAAVRVDWVNQALRPGEVSSLYFDPATYQLLEERDGPSGAPTSYDGPSPAYTAHERDSTSTSGELANPASITVMTSEAVVDSLPSAVEQCPEG